MGEGVFIIEDLKSIWGRVLVGERFEIDSCLSVLIWDKFKPSTVASQRMVATGLALQRVEIEESACGCGKVAHLGNRKSNKKEKKTTHSTEKRLGPLG
jgi:hypothetical protein